MKKILLLAAVAISAMAVNAKVWRVNPNEAAKADFVSVTDACNANKVNRGDTLYCEPGSYQGDQIVNKPQLTLLGPGWEIPTNFGSTSAIATASFTNQILVQADSTTIAGMWARQITFESCNLRDVDVERCMIGRIYSNAYYAYTLKNITIRNNFFSTKIYQEITPISLYSGSVLNINIENNIIVNYNEEVNSNYCNSSIFISAYNRQNVTALIAHNTIISRSTDWNGYHWAAIEAYYSIIRDNIIINRNTYEGDNESYLLEYGLISTCEVYNNVFSLTEENTPAELLQYFPNNYYIGANMANTFTCTIVNNAQESYFMLKEGSLAANAAYQGEDCGAYAGDWSFVNYGRPRGLPYIYDVSAPNYPTDDQLTISFKVKANNQ